MLQIPAPVMAFKGDGLTHVLASYGADMTPTSSDAPTTSDAPTISEHLDSAAASSGDIAASDASTKNSVLPYIYYIYTIMLQHMSKCLLFTQILPAGQRWPDGRHTHDPPLFQ